MQTLHIQELKKEAEKRCNSIAKVKSDKKSFFRIIV